MVVVVRGGEGVGRGRVCLGGGGGEGWGASEEEKRERDWGERRAGKRAGCMREGRGRKKKVCRRSPPPLTDRHPRQHGPQQGGHIDGAHGGGGGWEGGPRALCVCKSGSVRGEGGAGAGRARALPTLDGPIGRRPAGREGGHASFLP